MDAILIMLINAVYLFTLVVLVIFEYLSSILLIFFRILAVNLTD